MNFAQRIVRVYLFLIALVGANLLLSGCGTLDGSYSSSQGTREPAGATDGKGGFINRFQVGDLVRVDFAGTSAQMPPHEEHIKDDGTINLPLVGSLKAAGKSAGELQKEAQEAYKKYYKNLTVTVRGADLFYYVGGRVNHAGRQQYLGPITVTSAIKSAGDFDDFANRRKVKLIRADGSIHTINAVKASTNPELDLPVYPGDKIEVPERLF